MKFENTQVYNFEGALRGMRNPKESWDKNDSREQEVITDIKNIKGKTLISVTSEKKFVVGPNDLKLAQTLILAGSEHRKFLRQMFVSVDITAPLYWWKEFDTYKVGTVANSTSTMHKMAAHPITLDCFEIDDYKGAINIQGELYQSVAFNVEDNFIPFLEKLRQKFLETGDGSYWKELIRWLPESWLQTRTVTMSYENLLAICSKSQRRFHKLTEWRISFINWARTLPYAQEFLFIDESQLSKQEKINEILSSLGILVKKSDGTSYNTCEILLLIAEHLQVLPEKQKQEVINLIFN